MSFVSEFKLNSVMERGGSIYIMTNFLRTTLYVGVTSDLLVRIVEHRSGKYSNSFTSRYNLTICVFHKMFPNIEEAIAREKQVKKWRREKKDELIFQMNPEWKDLWNNIKEW
ncbi:GIY-YIG nuclease family protein [Pedobacter mucosus]|uniref:GIY-YIG nuclease family protein n=1 Tax=Pedobacter mucosus TaxID=2895286 RepID=UPI001EE43C0B|nr:GIY-YIG nuclease family protein [Pedobacter mucosus]UKT63692.1 GIY-YIG nuclease family protein [Pedobacter mucosus]